jgi:hypothetical protein
LSRCRRMRSRASCRNGSTSPTATAVATCAGSTDC